MFSDIACNFIYDIVLALGVERREAGVEESFYATGLHQFTEYLAAASLHTFGGILYAEHCELCSFLCIVRCLLRDYVSISYHCHYGHIVSLFKY